jgi:phosphatidylglycerophosphate synthase
MKKYIPNALSIFRLISILPLLILGYFKNTDAFLVLFFLAAISDVLDGYFARKLKLESELGRTLDSLADNLLSFVSIASLFLFEIPGSIDLIKPFGLFILYGLFVQLVGIIKLREFIAIHLWTMKILFIPSFLTIMVMIFSNKIPYLLINVLIFMAILATTEKLLIVLLLKRGSANQNVNSIFELEKVKKLFKKP